MYHSVYSLNVQLKINSEAIYATLGEKMDM